MARSRRSYNSGSESEFESEDDYQSDVTDDDHHLQNQQHHGGLSGIMGTRKFSASLPRLSHQPRGDDGHNSNKHTMSLSRLNYESGDSGSDSEDHQYKSPFRRSSVKSNKSSSGGAHNIFKDLLNAGKSRKLAKSSGISGGGGGALSDDSLAHAHGHAPPMAHPGHAPGARSSLTSASGGAAASTGKLSDSGSDSESGKSSHSDHHDKSSLFKNIMTGRSKKSSQNLVTTGQSAAAAASAIHQPPVINAPYGGGNSPNGSGNAKPNTLLTNGGHAVVESPAAGIPLRTPMSPLLAPVANSMDPIPRSLSETSLSDKYGKKEEVLGKGANAVVRLCCPVNSDKKFAIKEFRPRRKGETQVGTFLLFFPPSFSVERKGLSLLLVRSCAV
jgi:hypothetical protein